MDLGLEGDRASWFDLLRRSLALGFDEFSFRVNAQTRDMEQADTIHVQVAVSYRTRGWQTMEVDLGPAKWQDVDLVAPKVAGLDDLGVPVTSPVRCLSLAEQVAQKLHSCTGPHSSGRARDVLDIPRIDVLGELDAERTAEAARRASPNAGHTHFRRRSRCGQSGDQRLRRWLGSWSFPKRVRPLSKHCS